MHNARELARVEFLLEGMWWERRSAKRAVRATFSKGPVTCWWLTWFSLLCVKCSKFELFVVYHFQCFLKDNAFVDRLFIVLLLSNKWYVINAVIKYVYRKVAFLVKLLEIIHVMILKSMFKSWKTIYYTHSYYRLWCIVRCVFFSAPARTAQ